MPLDKETLKKIFAVFKTELNTHVNRMTECLSILEDPDTTPEDFKTRLNEFLRLAHTIKGSSKSLELNDISALAHTFEDLLTPLREQPSPLPESLTARLYQGLDALEIILASHLEGTPLEIDVQKLQQGLKSSEMKLQEPQVSKKTKPKSALPVTRPDEMFSMPYDKIVDITLLTDDIVSAVYHQVDQQDRWENFQQKLQELPSELAFAFEQNYFQLINSQKKLSLLSQTLQDQLQEARLVPMREIFSPLLRSAKKMAALLKKNCEIKFKGSNIEIDRLVLQNVKDPLIHLIRNALDHGIELPEKRLEKGKPERATLIISAALNAGRLMISVSDDGHGLPIETIKQRAIEQNLNTLDELSQLTDQQIEELIFLPGFSTKDKTSEISGRGVGLDLVSNKVALIQGHVSVTSRTDKGCIFTLNLPISLSANRGLFLTAGRESFIFLTTEIEHVLPFDANNVKAIQGQPVYQWTTNPIPLYVLQELLALCTGKQASQPFILIINGHSKRFALLVDDVLDERRIIIKPVLPPFSKIKGVIGGCPNAENKPILVLNPWQLIH